MKNPYYNYPFPFHDSRKAAPLPLEVLVLSQYINEAFTEWRKPVKETDSAQKKEQFGNDLGQVRNCFQTKLG
jgi:hypothetical protein